MHHPVAPDELDAAAALAARATAFHRTLAAYKPTPHFQLAHLARDLGVAAITLKDESPRFGLNAFKALGASFAMHCFMAEHRALGDTIFTTATDGNHGRAVAWMARQLGCRAVIYMPANSVPARVAAIVNEGAKVVLVAEGYDAAVARALRDGAEHGWVVIQDTATESYRLVPEQIAAGYWTMARELEAGPLGIPASVDLVVLHGGVGTWPSAMTQYLWHRYFDGRPRIVVVEPLEAACLLESAQAGKPVYASGSMRTIMAGLNCGFPSLAAFDVLAHSVDALIAIDDDYARHAMRRLAQPGGTDAPVVAGESGAASIAGLMALMTDEDYRPVRDHLRIQRQTRVLVWSTEGATDPDNWERVVGMKPGAVNSRRTTKGHA